MKIDITMRLHFAIFVGSELRSKAPKDDQSGRQEKVWMKSSVSAVKVQQAGPADAGFRIV
jgi:hypothetical protein